MEWLQFIEIIAIPAFVYVVYKINEINKELLAIQKDLNDFKIECAQKYATTEGVQRIENKIEDIRGMMITFLTKKGEKNA